MIKIKYEKPYNTFSFTSEDYFTVSNKKTVGNLQQPGISTIYTGYQCGIPSYGV